MIKPVVLASTSPWRAQMLEAAGVEIAVASPGVDEEEVKLSLRSDGVVARDQADALAEMKALRISSRLPGALVIGADQVLALGADAFDKPRAVDEARTQLRQLRAQRHDLFSAAVIALDGAPIWRHIGRARLTMRDFTDEFLEGYLEAMGDEVCETAGGYKIEGRGAQLFSRIEGDHFTILGLPLLELLAFLRVRGAMPE